jgi:hypothetical protein
MNLNVDYWKKKFIFPYADITPISAPVEDGKEKDHKMLSLDDAAILTDQDIKNMTGNGYKFPEKMLLKPEWREEVEKPLMVKVEDIHKDLYKLVKDFPIESIPHMSETDVAN